jgi:hypothetical protein
VDVELTGPDGLQRRSLWNDDALDMGKCFATGLKFANEPIQFKNYTITSYPEKCCWSAFMVW